MTAEELYELVIEVFGARGEKTNTSALCVLQKHADVLIGAIQNTPLQFKKEPTEHNDLRDARENIDSSRGKGEWTGYHAEMLIVSALLNYVAIDTSQSTENIKVALHEKVGDVSICADATCCKHCANMLDALGINYYGGKGNAGLTGWWNPLTDNVAPNGSLEFAKDIPE